MRISVFPLLLFLCACDSVSRNEDRTADIETGTTSASLQAAVSAPGMIVRDVARMTPPSPTAMTISTPRTAEQSAAAAVPNRVRNDLNGDGRSDVLWYNASIPAVAYWTMDGTTITGAAAYWTAPGFRIVGTGDFNADGRYDIVWDQPSTGDLYLWTTQADGGFDPAYLASYDHRAAQWIPSLIGDFNGDDKPDISWYSEARGAHALWLMDGATIVATAVAVGLDLPSAAADVLGIGRDQILIAQKNIDSAFPYHSFVSFLRYDGTALFADPATRVHDSHALFTNYLLMRFLGAADTNADGVPDLLWHDSVSGGIEHWPVHRTEPGKVAVNQRCCQSMQFSPFKSGDKIQSIGDYDGDGDRDDLLMQREASARNELYLLRGLGPTFPNFVGAEFSALYAPGWSVVP